MDIKTWFILALIIAQVVTVSAKDVLILNEPSQTQYYPALNKIYSQESLSSKLSFASESSEEIPSFEINSNTIQADTLSRATGQKGFGALELVRDPSGHLYLAFEYTLFKNFGKGAGHQFIYPGIGLAVSKNDGQTWTLVTQSKDIVDPEDSENIEHKYDYIDEEKTKKEKEACEARNKREIDDYPKKVKNLKEICEKWKTMAPCTVYIDLGNNRKECERWQALYCKDPSPPRIEKCDKKKGTTYVFKLSTTSDNSNNALLQGLIPATNGGVYFYYSVYGSKRRNVNSVERTSTIAGEDLTPYKQKYFDYLSPYKRKETLSSKYVLNRLLIQDGKIVSAEPVETDLSIKLESENDALRLVSASKEGHYFRKFDELYRSSFDNGKLQPMEKIGYVGTPNDCTNWPPCSSWDFFCELNKKAEKPLDYVKPVCPKALPLDLSNLFTDQRGRLFTLSNGAIYRLESTGYFKSVKTELSKIGTSYGSILSKYSDSFGLHMLLSANGIPYYRFISFFSISGVNNHPYASVTVVVGPNCKDCQDATAFLTNAGVIFKTENDPDAVKVAIKIETKDGTQTYNGFNKIRLAQQLQIDLSPEAVDTQKISDIRGLIYPGQSGHPRIAAYSTSQLIVYSFVSGKWQKSEALSAVGAKSNVYPSGSKVSWATKAIYAIKSVEGTDDVYLALFKEKIEQPLFEKTVTHLNKYALYTVNPSNADENEVKLGTVLSELVPFQKFPIHSPVSFKDTPALSVFSEPTGIVNAVLAKDETGQFYVDLTADARSFVKGGKIDIGNDKLSGKAVLKLDKQKIELPFEIPVKNLETEFFAYAAPSSLKFYMYQSKGVNKKIILVNNFAKTMTFSCGTVFSKVLGGKSIGEIDLPPVFGTCTLALDGVPTGQVLTFKRENLVGDTFWSKADVLAESVETFEERPLRFAECAGGYCNCEQAQKATFDFDAQTNAHANRINSEASNDALETLYSNGWTEKTVIRTGTFYDQKTSKTPKTTCPVFLAGKQYELKPGSVYELTLTIPQKDGRLQQNLGTTEQPKEIIPQWTYGTQSGFTQNEKEFTRMIEVR